MDLEPGEEALSRRGVYGAGITLVGALLVGSDLVRDVREFGAPFVLAGGVIAGAAGLWLVAGTVLGRVVVGHGYVRVRHGLRTTTFRRDADPQALRVHSRGWIQPKAGVLHLEQGGERATVRLSPANQQRMLDALQVRAYDFHPGGQSIESVPVELRPAVATRHSRELMIGLAVAAIVALFVWALVVTT